MRKLGFGRHPKIKYRRVAAFSKVRRPDELSSYCGPRSKPGGTVPEVLEEQPNRCVEYLQCDLQALFVFLGAIVHCETQITRLKATGNATAT